MLLALVFGLGFTDGRLNSDSLFLCSDTVIAFADWTSVSLTNLRYWSSPNISAFLPVSETVTLMISLMSRTKLSSRNGLPISSTTADSDLASLTNVAWTPGWCSWWGIRCFLLRFRGILLEFGDHHGYFGTIQHPTHESCMIVGQTHCTTGTFDDH